MKLPFWLKHDEWEKLPPRETDDLGVDARLKPRERAVIAAVRQIDRRSEWTARTVVERNNTALIVFGVLGIAIGATVLVVGPSKVWGAAAQLVKLVKQ